MTIRKKLTFGIVGGVLVLGIVFASFIIIRTGSCKDIIGDGYAMGTDPEPVIIDNTYDNL